MYMNLDPAVLAFANVRIKGIRAYHSVQRSVPQVRDFEGLVDERHPSGQCPEFGLTPFLVDALDNPGFDNGLPPPDNNGAIAPNNTGRINGPDDLDVNGIQIRRGRAALTWSFPTRPQTGLSR